MNIGNNIKNLRHLNNMTQEQLAEKLSISPQAVSKWETGTTLPDVTLLPEISVLLGVTIDELFTLSDEARFERIDNMLYDVRFLSESEFSQSEKYLIKKCNEETTRPKAELLLAQLYNKRADEYHQLASPLARRALMDNPDTKDAHNALFDAERGVYQDWHGVNHHRLIAFYYAFLKQHPDNFFAYLWLSDLLVADGRLEEAADVAETIKHLKHTYHYELLKSQIERAKGHHAKAQTWLDNMLALEPENEFALFAYANEMAKQFSYEEAIEYYHREMPLRQKPRFVDTEEALAQIYEIRGDFAAAIAMHEQIISIMQSDWKEVEGEGLDIHRREIERLKKLMS